MSVENCELLNKAKALATERGLDPEKVVCGGCTDTIDCPFEGSGVETDGDFEEALTLEEIKVGFFPNWTLDELKGNASH